MTIDLNRLIDVREQHERTALQRFAQEQRERDSSLQRSDAARTRLQAQHASKAAHWEAALSALAQGTRGVNDLRDAEAWSLALQQAIEQAERDLAVAQALTAEREAALEQARRRLHEASADVHKAREMALRLERERDQQQERRAEQAAEDHASQAWAARRAS